MEQVKAPEKIFLHPDIGGREFIRPWLKTRANQESVEYTRTDAFIEKSCEYIKEHLFDYWSQSVTNESKFIEDFINYMKGE